MEMDIEHVTAKEDCIENEDEMPQGTEYPTVSRN